MRSVVMAVALGGLLAGCADGETTEGGTAAPHAGSPDPTQAPPPSPSTPSSARVDLADYGTDLLAGIGASDITTGELPTVFSASMLANVGTGSVQLDVSPERILGARKVTGRVRLADGVVGLVLGNRSVAFGCDDASLVLTYRTRPDSYGAAELGEAKALARTMVNDSVCRHRP